MVNPPRIRSKLSSSKNSSPGSWFARSAIDILQSCSSRMPSAGWVYGSWLRKSSTSDCEWNLYPAHCLLKHVMIVFDRETGITDYADIVGYTAV
jgi:hypothetical protein